MQILRPLPPVTRPLNSMVETLTLEIITPSRSMLNETVDSVTIPGESGELGIMPGHTPLISNLKTGVLSYTKSGNTVRLLVSGGFVEVGDDRVAVLADVAERADEIDVAAARQSREGAERVLAQLSGETIDHETAQNDFDLASTRLQLVSGDPSATPTR